MRQASINPAINKRKWQHAHTLLQRWQRFWFWRGSCTRSSIYLQSLRTPMLLHVVSLKWQLCYAEQDHTQSGCVYCPVKYSTKLYFLYGHSVGSRPICTILIVATAIPKLTLSQEMISMSSKQKILSYTMLLRAERGHWKSVYADTNATTVKLSHQQKTPVILELPEYRRLKFQWIIFYKIICGLPDIPPSNISICLFPIKMGTNFTTLEML